MGRGSLSCDNVAWKQRPARGGQGANRSKRLSGKDLCQRDKNGLIRIPMMPSLTKAWQVRFMIAQEK